jgi:hypothetical protein
MLILHICVDGEMRFEKVHLFDTLNFKNKKSILNASALGFDRFAGQLNMRVFSVYELKI